MPHAHRLAAAPQVRNAGSTLGLATARTQPVGVCCRSKAHLVKQSLHESQGIRSSDGRYSRQPGCTVGPGAAPRAKVSDGVYAVQRDALAEKEVLPLKDGEVLLVHRHRYL